MIADQRGILLHGAHFEAFGLTLLEAMVSGLPVFTTKFGRAAETIVPGKTSFLINPTEMALAMDQVLNFVDSCNANPSRWQFFSEASVRHIRARYLVKSRDQGTDAHQDSQKNFASRGQNAPGGAPPVFRSAVSTYLPAGFAVASAI